MLVLPVSVDIGSLWYSMSSSSCHLHGIPRKVAIALSPSAPHTCLWLDSTMELPCLCTWDQLLITHQSGQGGISLYTILTPMLNPLIYSLRNKDVSKGFQKLRKGKLILYSIFECPLWSILLPKLESLASPYSSWYIILPLYFQFKIPSFIVYINITGKEDSLDK